jgi:hypothetical protein
MQVGERRDRPALSITSAYGRLNPKAGIQEEPVFKQALASLPRAKNPLTRLVLLPAAPFLEVP